MVPPLQNIRPTPTTHAAVLFITADFTSAAWRSRVADDRRALIAARLETIADVTNRANVDRAMRIRLHFAPQRRDTPIDAPSGDEHGIPPDGIQDRVA